MRRLKAELYHRSECLLGETPVWADGTLFWTDILGKALLAKPEGSGPVQKYPLPIEVGSFALWREDRIVLATDQGFHCFDLQTRALEAWANPEPSIPGNRFNDGKCDPRGRFVAGTINRAGRPLAALYALEFDKTVRKVYEPVVCSNGLAWSDSGTALYYIDTPTQMVRCFQYELEHGCLSDPRTVVEIAEGSGKPDGMTIDADGNLWIALYGAGEIECWNPRTRKPVARIEVPAKQVTSCVFGGAGYETLFITTARQHLGDRELREQPLAGSVFCVSPGVCGRPAVRFRCGS